MRTIKWALAALGLVCLPAAPAGAAAYILGDSLGLGVSMAAKLKNLSKLSVHIRGSKALEQFTQTPPGSTAFLVLGTNDAHGSIARLDKSIEAIVVAAERKNIKLIWMGPPCIRQSWDARARELDAILRAHDEKSLLRFVMCGSVDDGKSTLVGRLLYESQLLFEDQLAALEADSKRLGSQGAELDYALILDGLQAEREQGTTIDIAYRRLKLHEFLIRFDLSHPLLRAYRDRKVCMVNNFRSDVAQKKAIFDLLTDETITAGFPAAEKKAIREFIPWTRVVSGTKTTYGQQQVDLPEFILKNREKLVLRPNDDSTDASAFVGTEVDDSRWERALKTAMRNPYVVQEMVEPVYETFPLLQYGHLLGAGLAGRCAVEGEGDPFVGPGAGLIHHSLGQLARGLHVRRVVHQHQRLERRVGASAADGAGLAVRCVERAQRRRRAGALPEGVQAAAMDLLRAAVRGEMDRVAARVADRFPQSGGLRGFNARNHRKDVLFDPPPGPRGRRSTPDSAMRPRAQKCLVMALALCRSTLGRHHPRRRVIQYPGAARFDREAAPYWIPRFRGV